MQTQQASQNRFRSRCKIAVREAPPVSFWLQQCRMCYVFNDLKVGIDELSWQVENTVWLRSAEPGLGRTLRDT
jgi:hypothetical protein